MRECVALCVRSNDCGVITCREGLLKGRMQILLLEASPVTAQTSEGEGEFGNSCKHSVADTKES